MATAWHCDRVGCDTWSRAGRLHGFLEVKDSTPPSLHFCSWDCVLTYAAKISPLEVIGND